MAWLSVKQFADEVGLTVQGVHYLIKNGDRRLKSDRVGHQHVVDDRSVANFGPQAQKVPPVSQNGSKKKKRKAA